MTPEHERIRADNVWTSESLLVHLEQLITDSREYLEQLIVAQEKSLQAALVAQKEAILVALIAADKAVDKASTALEQRFKSLEERMENYKRTFQELTDSHFSTNAAAIGGLQIQITSERDRVTKLESIRGGSEKTWQSIGLFVGLLLTAALAVAAFIRH